MVSNTMLIVNLFVAIALILVLILKLKQNPVIAMFIAALYMGISSKVGMIETLTGISTGFGNTMKGIGISVGFGIMLGEFVAETGAVQSIANKVVQVFGKKKSDYAMGTTGFIVSIPVFYDVAYVILVPLAKTLSKQTKQSIAMFVGSLAAGLGIAHTFIPPTPGPLTGGELLNLDVGSVIIWGIIIGFPTFLISTYIYKNFILKIDGYWDEKCFSKEYYELEESNAVLDDKKYPGFIASVLPIIVPIILILIGTVYTAINGKDNVPELIGFISDKNFAMFCGVLSSFWLAKDFMNLEQMSDTINDSLKHAGTVLLITGMGGGLGSVLEMAGAGDALLKAIQSFNIHPILFVWLVSALMKLAQGSGTVAMITSVSLIVPIAATLPVNSILLAMASFSGTLMFAHVNDSAFWITTQIAGLSTIGGIKTYSVICAIQAVISLIIIFLLSLVI